MKILDVLYEFYGDFEFIKEKWNEKYEGILIKIKDAAQQKEHRKKKDILQFFGKNTKIT